MRSNLLLFLTFFAGINALLASPARSQVVVPNSGCNTCYSYVPTCTVPRIGQPFSVSYVHDPGCPACFANLGQTMWTSISAGYVAVPLGGWHFTCTLMVPEIALPGYSVTIPIPNDGLLIGLVFHAQQVCVKQNPYPPLFPSRAVRFGIGA
jgi:hypothetical protein